MAEYTLELEAEIYARMAERIVARTSLTQVDESSEVGRVLAAVARAIARHNLGAAKLLDIINIDRAKGADLDALAALIVPDGLARRGATRATGTIRFSRSVATPSAVVIPPGTRIARPGGSPQVVYVTTDDGEIPADETASVRVAEGGDIPIRAELAGSAGNAPVGSVTKVIGTLAGVNVATNPLAITGGVDRETDDAFRQRVKDFARTLARCTPDAVEALVIGAVAGNGDIITTAQSITDLSRPGWSILLVDNGAGTGATWTARVGEDLVTAATGGERRLFLSNKPVRGAWPDTFIDPGNGDPVRQLFGGGIDFYAVEPWGMIELTSAAFPSGLAVNDRVYTNGYQSWDGIVAKAQSLVDGDPADPVSSPAWRAEGTIIEVAVPNITWINVVATIATIGSRAEVDIIADVTLALQRYVNGLAIGADVIHSEMVEQAMRVSGVYDVEVTPAENVVVGERGLARIASVTVS